VTRHHSTVAEAVDPIRWLHWRLRTLHARSAGLPDPLPPTPEATATDEPPGVSEIDPVTATLLQMMVDYHVEITPGQSLAQCVAQGAFTPQGSQTAFGDMFFAWLGDHNKPEAQP
jgi:hypothetical protein